jgi:Tol biopolymer transport system component
MYALSGDTPMQRLTQSLEGNNSFPIWTPDGNGVTFTSDRDGRLGIYSQSTDGPDVAEPLFLADEGTSEIYPSSWSPDGLTLAFTQNINGLLGLWTLTDGVATEFYFVEGGVSNPTFSPDGNWVAYTTAANGNEIFVQPYPATGRVYRVTESDTTSSVEALWSPDGRELFYEQFPPLHMVAIDVDTSTGFDRGPERHLPIEGFFGVAPHRDFDVTPDGEQFLVAFPAGQIETGVANELTNPQINFVLNWFEELKERVPVD